MQTRGKIWISGAVVVVLLVIVIVFGAKAKNEIAVNISMPASRQLAVADSVADAGNIEEAMALYHLIGQGWKDIPDSDTDNARAALTALLVEAQIAFYDYNDYGKTLSALTQAKKLTSKFGFSQNGTNFLLGTLYCTIAAQNDVPEYFNIAAKYFESVLNDKSTDSELKWYAATNIILFADKAQVSRISENALKNYFKTPQTGESLKGQIFNRKIESLMKAVRGGNNALAVSIADSLSASSEIPIERVLPGIYFIAGQASADAGNYKQSLNFLLKSEKLVNADSGKDMQLDIYEAIANAYSHLGMREEMGVYAMKAGELRRSLTSFSQISSLKRVEIEDEINGIKDNLQTEKQRNVTLRRWIIAGIIFLLLASGFIGALVYLLARLRQSNRMLYRRYVDLLNVGNRGQDITPVADTTMDNEDNQQNLNGEIDDVSVFANLSSPETSGAAYKPSKADIDAIDKVLENAPELYTSNFSVAVMSELTGIKPRTLSTIISEHYGTTFRGLVNSRRVRNVCMILETTSQYDNLTVDAIAESVGIKSRTTFTSAFKVETGMTPAQYIKFAMERKNKL